MAHSFSEALFQCLTTLMGKIFSIKLMRTSCFPAGGLLPLILSGSSLALSSLYPPLRQLQTTVRSPFTSFFPSSDPFRLLCCHPIFYYCPAATNHWPLLGAEEMGAA